MRKTSDANNALNTSAANFSKIKDFIRIVRRKYKFMNDETAGKGGLISKCFQFMGEEMKMGDRHSQRNLKAFTEQVIMAPVLYRMICMEIIQERCYILKCVRKQLHSK